MEERTVLVPGISCGHCVMNIKRELGDVDGVELVSGDAARREITVRWREPATWQTIAELLEEIGYPPSASPGTSAR